MNSAATGGAGGGRTRAILRGLCPRCREGRIFRGRFRMNETCPSCGLRFSREEGYFIGSMYISYTLAVGGILILAGLLHLTVAPRWPLTGLLALGAVLFAPLVPASFRYARILWIHIDRALEP